MGHVDYRSGVISHHAQDLTRAKRLQVFAGLQNGQGAQQPYGVEFGVKFWRHGAQIGAHVTKVHNDVTLCASVAP